MNNVNGIEKSRLMGILSMVFGILAVVLAFTPFGRILVILLGGAAIVLGAIELDRVRRGLSDQGARNMAIAGIVLGGVSLILIILIPVIYGSVGLGAGHFDFGMMGKRGLPELGKFRHLK
jgi:hypothetical protein